MSALFIPKAAPPVRTSFVVDDGAGSDDDDVSGYVQLPEVVKTFLVYFRAQFEAKQDLQNIYEVHFGQLTERYFKASSWPPAETVAPFVDNGALRSVARAGARASGDACRGAIVVACLAEPRYTHTHTHSLSHTRTHVRTHTRTHNTRRRRVFDSLQELVLSPRLCEIDADQRATR